MKRLLLITFTTLGIHAISQTNTFPLDGNVGIGTISPKAILDVNGDTYIDRIFTTNNNAIDPSNPYSADIVIGSDKGSRHNSSMMFWSDGSASRILSRNDVFSFSVWNTTNPNVSLAATVGAASFIQGSLGIGTQNPAYKLDVLGTIRAKEVLVNLDGGADFVFEKDYKLLPIEHVANYVQENKHLPDIPSANEMVKNGVSMGDLQVKLLQKVEELTLYAIQQNKKIETLEKRINELETK